MRRIGQMMLGGALLAGASPASAADGLKFGPAPAWVKPQAIPASKPTDAPIAVLLNDQQITFDGGKITTYAELAFKIQNPQGLAAGNLSLVWQPATDSVTVNKVQIRRGEKVIDVLAAGQTFTVLRRETNLDAATLDGTLTANIQPEGLQEGDIIDFATTSEHSDPVLKGHVEAMFGAWNGMPLESGHAILSWPSGLNINVRQSAGLAPARKSTVGGRTLLELSASKLEPILPPSGAPGRFQVGRLAEASDYSSWAGLSDLMIPLYRSAETVPASGPLHDEVERIRASANDPKRRAEQALALVQDRVRYVALLMGQGGYVPATAETTWSRRFGDCKAKTALLLGILHSLGIEAEPVLVQSKLGDILADRLPMLELFNHVLVRAHIGGKTYWLDGTRSGDTSLDDIATPDFGWGLPLVRKAELERIMPQPLNTPESERRIDIDASSGVLAPAKVSIAVTYHGDSAVGLNSLYSQLTTAQREQTLIEDAKRYFDTFSKSSSSVQFAKDKRDLAITISGTAKLGWKDGWLYVPGASVAFNPDFDRPAGPAHDAPFATAYPDYNRTRVVIHLPAGFAAEQKFSAPVHETLAGVEYVRTSSIVGNVVTIETSNRSLVPEVPYKDAIAAEGRLRVLDKDDVYLRMPDHFQLSREDNAAILSETPASAAEYTRRASILLDASRFDEAIADLTKGLELEPKRASSLADRGLAYVWKADYPAAEKDLAAAEAIDANNAVVFRARGLMAEQKNDFKAAVEAYTRALKIEPESGFALGHRARVFRALGADDKALADSEQALKTQPAWTELRLMRATILLGLGKREGAAAEAVTLMKDNPASSYAMVGAARIYSRLGMKTESMQAFDKAIAIKPEAFIYINRAQSRPFTDAAGRIADLDAALKLEPESSDALAEKAEQLVAAGDYQAAIPLYDRALKAAPNAYLPLRRAIVLYKAGHKPEAQKLLTEQRAKAKTPRDFNNLCWAKAIGGIELDSALLDCQESLRLQPDSGATIDSLAFVKLRMGKVDEAISLYTRAIEKKAGSASYMGRAIAYSRKGDKAHSDADRSEALKLDPDAETRFAEYGVKL